MKPEQYQKLLDVIIKNTNDEEFEILEEALMKIRKLSKIQVKPEVSQE